MDFNNLVHNIVLHYAVAIALCLIVTFGLISDLGISLALMLIGWLAFCKAGYLTLCHDQRTFGQNR